MKAQERRNRRWVKEFLSLVKPYLKSEEKWIAIACFLIIVVINVAIVYLTVVMNKWYKEFYDVVGSQNKASYYAFCWQYIWIATPWLALARIGSYLRYRLKLSWRVWMTKHFMSLWLENQKHYFWVLTEKQIDNPDQRIAQDIPFFIDSTLTLSLDMLDRLVTLISFIGILWGLSGVINLAITPAIKITIPAYLVWLSILYALVANGLVYALARKIVPLQYEQQHLEADFRFSLVEIRENSESIAFSRGEATELKTRVNIFSRVVSNFRALIRKYIQLEIFDNIHDQVRAVFPMFAAAPRLLSGAIKVGGFFQITNAVERVETSISFLVRSFRTIADWRSSIKRLVDLEQSFNRAQDLKTSLASQYSGVHALKIQNVSVMTPDKRQILKNLSLEITHQERVLFKGRSGSGKSTLFRVFAGIWPFFSGQVGLPQEESITFLSQIPYLPRGTIRQILIYPYYDNPISDDVLAEQLKRFDLELLVPKLHVEESWHKILSPGEKQRLVLIRALLQKPKWLFLDEATSAMDAKNRATSYESLMADLKGSAIVSIEHGSDVESFYTRTVNISS